MNEENGHGKSQHVTPEQAYQGLRNMALTLKAEEIGVKTPPREPYAVVMEIGFPRGTATLVAVAEGTVSLYYSSGGGVLGAGAHDSVRSAGFTLLAEAADHIDAMDSADGFPMPTEGRVRFYVLTSLDTYTTDVAENELETKKSPFWPLYFYGQEVLTELRLISEKRADGS